MLNWVYLVSCLLWIYLNQLITPPLLFLCENQIFILMLLMFLNIIFCYIFVVAGIINLQLGADENIFVEHNIEICFALHLYSLF